MGLIREDGTPKPALDDLRPRCREMGLMQWFHFEDPRLDDAVAWMKRLGTKRICAPAFRGRTASARTRCDWFDRQMEALADFEVTVTFCFTPEHLGTGAASYQPGRCEPQRFADFCAWMIDRYAPARRALIPRDQPEGSCSMLKPHPRARSASRIVGVGNCASSLVQGIAALPAAAPTT